MIIENPFIDLQEAYRNRARIEKMRLQESIKLRPVLSEFADPHYPIHVRKPAYQHRSRGTTSAKTRQVYQSQAHTIFEPSQILPYGRGE